MPVSLKPRRNLLEEGCRFRIGPRPAEVIAVRPEGYVVIWEEWTDRKTGVVQDSAHELLKYPRVETENSHGQLVFSAGPECRMLIRPTFPAIGGLTRKLRGCLSAKRARSEQRS